MSSSLPLYLRICSEIRSSIYSGDRKAGSPLPSESRLCSEYGVSRETVRKALSLLENEGLILSRPKIGYFVADPDLTTCSLTLPDFSRCARSRYLEVHGAAADPELAALLETEPGRFILRLVRLGSSGPDQPVLYEEKYLLYERSRPSVESEMRYAVLPELTLEKMSTFRVYSEVRVLAEGAQGPVCRHLDLPAGAPVLRVDRLYRQQDGRIIGLSRCWVRSSRLPLTGRSGNTL